MFGLALVIVLALGSKFESISINVQKEQTIICVVTECGMVCYCTDDPTAPPLVSECEK